jgi:hypothetical protein
MSRKPRFKVQRRNSYDYLDLNDYGRKQWNTIVDDRGHKGHTMTFEEATARYWKMADLYPDEVYRIVEKR